MPPTSIRLALVALAAATLHAAPAHACDPTEFLTPIDLVDRAAVVAVIEVTAITRATSAAPQIAATVVEPLKGGPGATLALTAPGGTCEPGFAVGRRGLVYVDAAGHTLGLYTGFLTAALPAWTVAVRAYLGGATAGERGAGLVDLAVGRDWTASLMAALALIDRVDLLVAIEPAARARVAARAARLRKTDHPIHLLATRLQLTPPTSRARRRPGAALAAVALGAFEGEADPAALARAILAPPVLRGLRRRCDLGTGVCFPAAAQVRIAALERCERVHGRTLDHLGAYAGDPDDVDAWRARAEACRTGTPRTP